MICTSPSGPSAVPAILSAWTSRHKIATSPLLTNLYRFDSSRVSEKTWPLAVCKTLRKNGSSMQEEKLNMTRNDGLVYRPGHEVDFRLRVTDSIVDIRAMHSLMAP